MNARQHPDPFEVHTSPPLGRAFWTGIALLVAIVVGSVVLCSGCVGAPHSAAELVAMPQPAFDSWKSRLANTFGTAAYAATKDDAGNAEACALVADALRAAVGTPIDPATIHGLGGDWAPFLSIALGELQAALGNYTDDEAAAPRIAEVLLACAEQIDVGVAQAMGAAATG